MRHTDISFDGYRPKTTTLAFGQQTAAQVYGDEVRRDNFMAITHDDADSAMCGWGDAADASPASETLSTAKPAVSLVGITATDLTNNRCQTDTVKAFTTSTLPPILAEIKSTAPRDATPSLVKLTATTAAAFADSLPTWFGTSTGKLKSTSHADYRLPIQIQSLRAARVTSLHKMGLGADSNRRNAPQSSHSLRSVQMSNGQMHNVSYGVRGRPQGLSGRVRTAAPIAIL
jgi:hypothetical protein